LNTIPLMFCCGVWGAKRTTRSSPIPGTTAATIAPLLSMKALVSSSSYQVSGATRRPPAA
jgi:hypothetical protein